MKDKKVSIYDPFEADCLLAKEAITELFDRSGIKVIIKAFTDREAFTCDFRDNRYDMAFVGIGTFLDFEVARSVRKLDEKCPLFLVSRTDEYALEGIRMSVLDYLIKPVTLARLREALSRTNLSLVQKAGAG